MEDDLYEIAGETLWEKKRKTSPPTTKAATTAAKPKATTTVAPTIEHSDPLAELASFDSAVDMVLRRERDLDVVPVLEEIERQLRALRSFHSEESIRLRVHELNKRLAHQNHYGLDSLLPLDIDRVIDRWRRDRGGD